MRRKNITFGLICFTMMFGVAGGAFAELGPSEISMGMFSIPLPANGKDGCAPLIRSVDSSVDSSIADGCYTIQQKQQTRNASGNCVDSGDWTAVQTVCDGQNGANGAVNMEKVYVPYPASTFDNAEPQNEGYIKVTIPAADENDEDTILKYPDYCEEFYENGITKKKCVAQGDATAWQNSNGTGIYQTGETYVFAVEQLDGGYPRDEYTTPRLSGGNSGYPTAPGVTNKVYKYTSGRTRSEFVAEDSCAEYAKPDDTTDRVKKCTVWAPISTPGLTSAYAAGTVYCLGNHQSDCDNYTVRVGAVNTCATLSSSDDAWTTTVDHTESEYVDPDYDPYCTEGCSGTLGYKLTKEVMCSGDTHETKPNDTCTPAQSTGVTCASGHIWQTCTKQTAIADDEHATYSGCFQDPFNDLYARRTDIVPANFAADSSNLYYCKIADCDSTSECWIGNDKANGPNPNATTCWGTVSINGLQGDAGPGCSFIYNGTKWQVCCLPVGVNGVIDTTQSWSCNDVDASTAAQLNQWLCKPTYTTFYLTPKAGGGYNETATSSTRPNDTVGIRTKITNCDGTQGATIDTFDGEDGDNYNPCDGLTSAEAQTTIQSQTSVYRSSTYSQNHFSPARGYYETTINYCEGSATTYKEDKCEPVSLASGNSRTVGTITCAANQTLMRCTPQAGASTDPYFICEDAEVSGYPKKVYVAPTTSNDKFTAVGYTKWVHKFASSGAEVSETQRNIPDECHEVFKRTLTVSGDTTRTATTTTTSALKCTVQDYPNPTSPWTVGTTYCLNAASATASTSCDGYDENITATETSELKYHLPIMDTTNTTTPVEPGYVYREEVSGNSVLRETALKRDDCETRLTRTTSGTTTTTASVRVCTVRAPGSTTNSDYETGDTYCLGYAGGTCPDTIIDIGTAVDDAAENDPCAGSTSATDVQKVISRTYSRTANSQGAMVSTYTMCDDSTHTESTPDECKEVPTPAGQTCTNGVWMQCTRQADEGTGASTARGTTYGYCAVYPQCVGNESSTSIVKKTQRSYTAPTKTGSNSYYDTVGKITDVKIACNGTTISTEESAEDQCDEIPNTASVCPTNKVLKTCTRKGNQGTSNDTKAGTTYNLCTTGPSIYGSIADNDPCGGDTTSDSAKKKVKSIQYEYITKDATGNTAKVGYSKKTTTMCNQAGNTDEYIYDTCIPVASASGCNGANDKNYKCYNQTKLTSTNASEREYNTCNPSSNVSSVALSNKIDDKLDNDVTFTTGTYDNKDYILMSATGITNKPVVPVDDLKPQSLFDTWKEEQKNKNWTATECTALFGSGVNCTTGAGLTTDMMFESFSDYGIWKQEQVESGETDGDKLTTTAYRSGLICPGGIEISPNGSNENGNKYVMTCAEMQQ